MDRCVQSLRRRLALENTALSAEEEETKGKLGFLNRVPSFYTSRSIVNLSGLSVSDPQPVVISGRSKNAIAELEKQDEYSRTILAAIADDRGNNRNGERGSSRRSALNKLRRMSGENLDDIRKCRIMTMLEYTAHFIVCRRRRCTFIKFADW